MKLCIKWKCVVILVKNDSAILDYRNCVNGGRTFLCGKIRTIWEMGAYKKFIFFLYMNFEKVLMKMANIRLLMVKNVELRTDVLAGAIWELPLLRFHCKPCLKQPRKRVQKRNLRGSENNYLGTLLLRNWKRSQSN